MPISLILVDKEPLFRCAVRETLTTEDIQVVDEASDGPGAVKLAAALRPTVAVLSAFLPIVNGLDTAKEIQRVSPQTGVVLLAFQLNGAYIREALTAGVAGFVSRA